MLIGEATQDEHETLHPITSKLEVCIDCQMTVLTVRTWFVLLSKIKIAITLTLFLTI